MQWRLHLQSQARITSRHQALAAGWSEKMIATRLRTGAWRRLQRGSYATFTGDASRDARLWAAILRAGQGAVLSHETAAEIHGFADKPAAKIHISIPERRRPARGGPIPGVIVHRRRVLEPAWTAPWELPRTTVEDTVLDLVDAARTFDDAYGWTTRALSVQATTVGLLRKALANRKRSRWRTWLTEALADAGDGVNSPLERRYAIDVEQAHSLPTAVRQAKFRSGTGAIYLDNLYADYGVCVELDGLAAHPPESRRRDARRDNANLVERDIRTLRFEWPDATETRCETAIQVGRVLRRHGWDGHVKPCGPGCVIASLATR
ncbi:MAG TPA: hypothetical protein VFB06_08325 [Streptosporangiaceae bacterium]|nr:hypothetical protein [Streptosporangiaceae bacterium]